MLYIRTYTHTHIYTSGDRQGRRLFITTLFIIQKLKTFCRYINKKIKNYIIHIKYNKNVIKMNGTKLLLPTKRNLENMMLRIKENVVSFL